MQRRYEISDEQWNKIKHMFPKAKTGRPGKDLRLMFNAVLWIACSGAPWRDLPERFGSCTSGEAQVEGQLRSMQLLMDLEIRCT